MSMSAMMKDCQTQRAEALYKSACSQLCRDTDRIFIALMLLQWVLGMLMAVAVTPRTWIGTTPYVHIHVWAATGLGAAISSLPIALAIWAPGKTLTRHVIAIAQMLWSALLIHLSGGRIETHFHVFGSLAFLAFYRDWRVLLTATVVAATDHFVRGYAWPLSVFGTAVASPFLWLEHAAWIVFEDIFLVISCVRGMREMRLVGVREAALEATRDETEQRVRQATSQLRFLNEKLNVEVAERKETEESLRVTQYALDHAADAAFWLDPEDGAILYANDAACNSLGYSKAELTSRRLFDVDGRLSRESWPSLREELQAAGRVSVESFHLRADGTQFPVELVAYFVELEDRAYCMVYAHDLTERIRAEQRATRLGRLVEDSRNEIYIFDAETLQFLEVNRGARENLGYTLEELRQKTALDIKPQAHREDCGVYLRRLRSGEAEVASFETVQERADGSQYPIDVRLQLSTYEERPAFVAMVVDVTARAAMQAEHEQMQRQLMDASREAGMAEIATGVLHNVGNVLNSVSVSAEMICERLRTSRVPKLVQVVDLLSTHREDLAAFLASDPRGQRVPEYLERLAEELCSEQEEHAGEIARLAEKLAHIKEIVQMQQAYAGRAGAAEPVDITALLDDAVRLNEDDWERLGVEVVRDYAEIPEICTEKHQILQVLINLVSNARKAMREAPGPGRLHLSVRTTGTEVVVRVSDTGIGIPPENLKRIFSHGFTTSEDGHGFGLHSSAIAAKRVGGSLCGHSDGPGQGAVFTLTLPAEVRQPEFVSGEKHAAAH